MLGAILGGARLLLPAAKALIPVVKTSVPWLAGWGIGKTMENRQEAKTEQARIQSESINYKMLQANGLAKKGAIVGAVGLGLYLWNKSRKRW